jgi:hypothetical protein
VTNSGWFGKLMNKIKGLSSPEHCENCGHPLGQQDHYCPGCGQKALPEHLTFRYFAREFLNNYFSFDSKFFKTMWPLLVRPGFLSSEFLKGRRIRYINPIQLFIFSSFIYFLINSFMFLKEDAANRDMVKLTDESKVAIDSLQIRKSEDLYIIDGSEGEKADTLNSSYLGEFLSKSQEFNKLDRGAQNEKISKVLSYGVFLLMPLFALYVGRLFKRRHRRYLENLVFSLHFHAFYFLSGSFFLLMDKLLVGQTDSILHLGIALIYLFVALVRFYGFSWWSSALRFLGLTLTYGITTILFMVISLFISILI